MLVSPVTFAASLTTGSSRHPLILMHRYALPRVGSLGSQWSLYLSISSSSIRLLNGLANCMGRCLCDRSFEINSQPHCTSVLILDPVFCTRLCSSSSSRDAEGKSTIEEDRDGREDTALEFTAWLLCNNDYVTN